MSSCSFAEPCRSVSETPIIPVVWHRRQRGVGTWEFLRANYQTNEIPKLPRWFQRAQRPGLDKQVAWIGKGRSQSVGSSTRNSFLFWVIIAFQAPHDSLVKTRRSKWVYHAIISACLRKIFPTSLDLGLWSKSNQSRQSGVRYRVQSNSDESSTQSSKGQ